MGAADKAAGIFVQEIAEDDGGRAEDIGAHHEDNAVVLADDVEQFGLGDHGCGGHADAQESGLHLRLHRVVDILLVAAQRHANSAEAIGPGDDGAGELDDIGAGLRAADDGRVDVVFIHHPEEFFSAEKAREGDVGIGVDEFHAANPSSRQHGQKAVSAKRACLWVHRHGTQPMPVGRIVMRG